MKRGDELARYMEIKIYSKNDGQTNKLVHMYNQGFYNIEQKLNPWNKAETDDLIPVSQLVSLHASDNALTETPDKTIYMSMDFNKIDNYHFHDPLLYPISAVERSKHLYLPQINYISNLLPPAPPLTQYKDIPQVRQDVI